MNKKDFKKIKAKELESLLEALGASRMDIAAALGVGESTLRRWVRNRQVPLPEWEKLNSPEFKKTLGIQKKFGANHYIVPEKDSEDKNIVYSKAPPSEEDGDNETIGSHQIDLSLLTLDQLVDEIEYRGWKVQISRKTEENK